MAKQAKSCSGRRSRGMFLTIDVVFAMLLLFTIIILSYAYFSTGSEDAFSSQLMRGYLQDASTVLSKKGYLTDPLASSNSTNTAGIREILRSTPAAVCMQVSGYGSSAPLQDGLVGYWQMDEATGATSLADSSGAGATGKTVGAVSFVEDARAGRAAKFSGSGNYISTVDYSWGYNDSFTIVGWAKIDPDAAGLQPLVGKASPNWEYTIYGTSGGTLAFVYWNTGGGHAIDVSTGGMTAGQWNQFAVAYDGNTHKAVLYLNGASKAAGASSGNAVPHQDRTQATDIASSYIWGAGYLKGMMDEVRIYNRSLSDAEISQLYSNPSNLLYVVNKQDCIYTGGELQSLTIPFAYNRNQNRNDYYYAVLRAWPRGYR